MDTRFSVAIHMLVLISEAEEPMSSAAIAESTGTNASYIRKLGMMLKDGGIISGHQGKSGFELCVDAKDLPLMAIYQAIYGTDRISLFDIHQNANDICIVGRHIKPVLERTFRSIGQEAEKELSHRTLADCIRDLKKEAGYKEKEQAK